MNWRSYVAKRSAGRTPFWLLTSCIFLTGIAATRGTVIIEPEDTTVCQGDSATLKCAFSEPIDSHNDCLWTKNSVPISIDAFKDIYMWDANLADGECSIVILSTDLQRDDGRWQCGRAKTPTTDGEVSHTANLVVGVTPSELRIIASGTEVAQNISTISFKLNSDATFTCSAREVNPRVDLEWTLNDTVVIKASVDSKQETSKNNTYHVWSELKATESHFDKHSDGNILRCSIQEHPCANRTLRTRAILNVLYETTTVTILTGSIIVLTEGATMLLPCVADGNPRPRCEWYRSTSDDDWTQFLQDCNFWIRKATESDEGNYKCMAGNTNVLLTSNMVSVRMEATVRNKVAIVGGTVGGLFALTIVALAGFIAYLRYRRRSTRSEDKSPSDDYMDPRSGLDSEYDDLPPCPPRPPHDYLEVSKTDTYGNRISNIYEEPIFYENILALKKPSESNA